MSGNKSITDIANTIEQIGQKLPNPNPASANHVPREDYVEAINQVFALFRLNYHNQYYAAYPDAEQVKQIKKLWLESLTKYPVAVILQGAKQAIEHSDYLPTLSKMHQFCIDYLQQIGIPSAHDAYIEACSATSPKREASWSHPIVYLAGRDTGWYELANEREAYILPNFERHFSAYLDRVLAGETFELPALPKPNPESKTLSREQQLRNLAALKSTTQL
jgi:hypothetical protein